MDGVAFVSQCPILPGQSFNYYTFKPRFSGTYWYHSHMGNQRDMGLYGAFICLFFSLCLILVVSYQVEGFVCPIDTHCMTSLIVKSAFTMIDPTVGPVYVQNRTIYPIKTEYLGNALNLTNVITADGWNTTRNLITVNGTMPGPPIFLYQNQTITIIVKNNLINEPVTIHWHGIDQLGWPAMDGVAFVSQCPILPGQSFNYTFKPRFSGTYWYHSHMGNQRDMGLYGAFIVLKRENEIPIPQQYIIQLMEWNHLYNPITLLKAEHIDTTANSILINGRGEFEDNMAPLETFKVDKKDKHLFRMIGTGSNDTLLFSVPGLRLIVKETDGYEFVQQTVDRIIIYPAERYDFELDFQYATEGIYNMTVYILEGSIMKIREGVAGLGQIHVTNRDSLQTISLNRTTEVILNCPFQVYPMNPNFTCLPVSELKSKTPGNGVEFDSLGVQRTDETYTHFLNFGFPQHSSINGRKFIWPTVSALSQPAELDTSCKGCDAENSCECSHSLELKSGSEVIMILSNLGTGMLITHPVHMHGHTFEVLKIGFPSISSNDELIANDDIQCSETKLNNESQCNNARWRNSSWNDYKTIPGINLEDPVRKDTIISPYGGYTIIRIRATNPGVWFMHCHIDPHMISGMALMLNESFENIKELPEGLPTCHSFNDKTSSVASLRSEAEAVNFTNESNNNDITVIVLGVLVGLLSLALIVACVKLIRSQGQQETGQSLQMQPVAS
ncbi:uncharacterized protein LOC133193166 [Saccostrea echinata]|uniref:uncharacterized protein LOC133193166 n=1 Tax=Saccostrea echinata TaxID=191078 RepID=UPI002A80E267|nr:uncharacterized protein LOC133193166 [Saccostrea echinata]